MIKRFLTYVISGTNSSVVEATVRLLVDGLGIVVLPAEEDILAEEIVASTVAKSFIISHEVFVFIFDAVKRYIF